jgi:hypothetical protein
MRTSEIFEMQMAYGETGYFDGVLAEFENDVLPQLDRDQLIKLREAIWEQYQALIKKDNDYQQDLPF